MTEKWKEIAGFEKCYEISSIGRVKSLRRNIILRPRAGNGYHQVILHVDGKRHERMVNRLVAAAFIGDIKGRVVHHVNRNRTDNRACNLEIVTQEQNMQYAAAAGVLGLQGEANGRSKLSVSDVIEIRRECEPGSRTRGGAALARKYGVGKTAISDIINKKKWKSVGD